MDLVEHLTASLDLSEVDELAGGHQSRVFRAVRRDGEPVAVKSIDASTVDRNELETRLSVIAALADLDSRVCRPLLLAGDLVVDLAMPEGHDLYIVGYEFAFGEAPDVTRSPDAALMGAALAALHKSMRGLPTVTLPVVGALRAAKMDGSDVTYTRQLLHGDFSSSNLCKADNEVRIFDFDDCGYGPLEFDVANALYMVLFDQTTSGTSQIYESFRQSFIDGYGGASGASIQPEILDHFIDLRVHALATWLDDLDNAPIGIRTASNDWHATLRSFVLIYRSSSL